MVRAGIIITLIWLIGCTHYVKEEPVHYKVHYKKQSIQEKIDRYKKTKTPGRLGYTGVSS